MGGNSMQSKTIILAPAIHEKQHFFGRKAMFRTKALNLNQVKKPG